MDWKNPAEKVKNFQDVKDIHQKIGFDLLLDEHRYLKKNGQKIAFWGLRIGGKDSTKQATFRKHPKN